MDKILKHDIKKVKELLMDAKYNELRKLCKTFTSLYNAKILSGLNLFELNEWLRINDYIK